MALEDSRWIIHKGSGFNESLPSQNIHSRFTCGALHCGRRNIGILCVFFKGETIYWLPTYRVRSSCIFVGNRCTTRLLDKPCQVNYFYSSMCIQN